MCVHSKPFEMMEKGRENECFCPAGSVTQRCRVVPMWVLEVCGHKGSMCERSRGEHGGQTVWRCTRRAGRTRSTSSCRCRRRVVRACRPSRSGRTACTAWLWVDASCTCESKKKGKKNHRRSLQTGGVRRGLAHGGIQAGSLDDGGRDVERVEELLRDDDPHLCLGKRI